MASPVAGNYAVLASSPRAVAITPSDSTDLTGVRQIYIGGAGNLAVRLTENSQTTVTFIAPPVGLVLNIQVTRVMAATTATNLVGLY